MSRFLTLFLLWSVAFVAARAGGLSRADELRAAFLDSAAPDIFVAAHRADWRGFPENSLPAIESALRMGVGIIEVDVGRTKDGQFIIMHDETLDRTTTGRGKVADHTLAEIRALTLRNGCGVPTGYTVPTLEEALLAVKGRALINLDKSYAWLREFFPILERTGTTRQVIIKTYNLPAERVLQENGDIIGQVLFMPIANFKKPGAADIARGHLARTKPPALELAFPQWRGDVEQVFAACAASGARIWANTMWTGLTGDRCDDAALEDPDAHYGWLLAHGVTLIQTDRPEFLLSYLRQHARHP